MSHCASLRCSFPVRLLPLPAPAGCGHAKPYVPLGIRASERRRASLAGLASPRPANPWRSHRQAVNPPRVIVQPPERSPQAATVMTGCGSNDMVNGRKNARREYRVKVLLIV
ncbi:hypothetical protein LU604_04000 [Erwinia tracheiphila]|uniref:Uncharacterized protein n=1 Tax=Erwinia tracheiphila TaxID=65700 RepID=A0A345CUG0_9GAMM|nr:hypothetical protein [Erwinia tracheiphila]AXF77077.1 hypothetical protein AV903_15350 [Erwinia tracheiphila]UIA84237.1 hypothetical protein LU604_04000 [Erwinia tracheiphila]